MNSSEAAQQLRSANSLRHGACCGACRKLIAVFQLEGVQEEFKH